MNVPSGVELFRAADRIGRRRWFRALFAICLLAAHLVVIRSFADERMHLPWNSAPTAAGDTSSWNRLLVSRWDSEHYIWYATNGFTTCPPADLRENPAPPGCKFQFYPGYPLLGRKLVELVPTIPPDYALFGISLLASFFFLFLWTGPALAEPLGLGRTYLSLILLNLFTTGFAFVTVQTEPVTMLAELVAFILLRRRYFVLGAVAIGFTGLFRITGFTLGFGYFVAVAVYAWTNREVSWKQRLGLLAIVAPLCEWGQLALSTFFWRQYSDPLIYLHSHTKLFDNNLAIEAILRPPVHMLTLALTMGLHEGIFILTAFLWLGLGLRDALSGFSPVERAYWIAAPFSATALSLAGSSTLAFAGMNRYWLVVFPLFFSMATAMRRRPVALVVWSAFSFWHYRNVDLCAYLAQWESARYCHMLYRP